MNPITYCAFASCSESDFQAFGVIALSIVIVLAIIGIIDYFATKHKGK